jgi:hypothetical protein
MEAGGRPQVRTNMARGVDGEGSPDPRERFRWECPYCGNSRITRWESGTGMEHAKAALLLHVLLSEGDGHGPRNEYPEGFDREGLVDYVTRPREGDERDPIS